MPATASAAFHFDSQASLVKKVTTAGSTVALTLDSVDGVRTVLWEVASTDGSFTAGDYDITNATSTSASILIAVGATGQSILVKCTVNDGMATDPNTGTSQPSPDLVKTAKIVVLCDNGNELGSAGEQTESNATYGAADFMNNWARNALTSTGPIHSNWIVSSTTTGSVTPSAVAGNNFQYGATVTTNMTGDIAVGAPAGTLSGQVLRFRFRGDGTHKPTWNAAFKFGTAGAVNADPGAVSALTINKAYTYEFVVLSDATTIECRSVTVV